MDLRIIGQNTVNLIMIGCTLSEEKQPNIKHGSAVLAEQVHEGHVASLA